MKVVLFCGGSGIRLPDGGETLPKPMVRVGDRPLLWHVMRSYAHWGMRDFILCLGAQGGLIKDYFLSYDETLTNDFTLSDGGRRIDLHGTDIQDWRIAFADTGQRAEVGARLLAVRDHLEGESVFCANYGDIVTNAPLPELVADFLARDKVAALLSVRPSSSFHVVEAERGGIVTAIRDVAHADLWANGGYYLFRDSIFDYIHGPEDLVAGPFRRLIAEDQLIAYRYDGFWTSLDTLKDLQNLERLHETGRPPWAVWLESASDGSDATLSRDETRQ
ncbi:MAG: sugar phosphate nucleotidyltransferase [Candidatus Limnocylindrales bacterium]